MVNGGVPLKDKVTYSEIQGIQRNLSKHARYMVQSRRKIPKHEALALIFHVSMSLLLKRTMKEHKFEAQ